MSESEMRRKFEELKKNAREKRRLRMDKLDGKLDLMDLRIYDFSQIKQDMGLYEGKIGKTIRMIDDITVQYQAGLISELECVLTIQNICSDTTGYSDKVVDSDIQTLN